MALAGFGTLRFAGCQGFTEPDLSTLRYKTNRQKDVRLMPQIKGTFHNRTTRDFLKLC
jgi:hypothetical protein